MKLFSDVDKQINIRKKLERFSMKKSKELLNKGFKWMRMAKNVTNKILGIWKKEYPEKIYRKIPLALINLISM